MSTSSVPSSGIGGPDTAAPLPLPGGYLNSSKAFTSSWMSFTSPLMSCSACRHRGSSSDPATAPMCFCSALRTAAKRVRAPS
jgi:hypothetical protein